MNWLHVLETFIGAAFAFLFGWILQRNLIKRQEEFHQRMMKEQQDFMEQQAAKRRKLDIVLKNNPEILR